MVRSSSSSVGAPVVEQREPAEEHLDPGHELPHGKRLAQVVVGAELETENAVELLVPRGQEHDGDRLRQGSQTPAQLESVHPGHDDVEDHEIGEAGLERLPGGEAVGVALDLVALPFEGEADVLADVLLVFDDCNVCLSSVNSSEVANQAQRKTAPQGGAVDR